MMINTIKIIFNIMASTNVNKFIYFFKRLWGVGKLMPDTIYEYIEVKGALSILISVFTQFGKLFGKTIYLLLMVVLPILYAMQIHPDLKGYEFTLAIHILFIMNCLLGSILDSQIFNVTHTKYVCIKYMHMNSRRYILAAMVIKYVPFYIYYLIHFLVMSLIFKGSIIKAILFLVAYICFRLMGEALQLWLYDKTHKVLSRQNLILIPIIIIATAAAYVPMFLGSPWTISNILLHPVTVILYLSIGGIALYYIAAGYSHYQTKIPRSLDEKYLFSEAAKNNKEVKFADVAIKEKDLSYSNLHKEKYDNRKGYSYLNAIFFSRHHRLLVKPVYIRLMLVGLALLVGMGIYILDRELAIMISQMITDRLPIFVFIMYLITVAAKACKAMFYNCDISLLRYGFYRKPKTILYNFNIRLIRISIFNLIIGVSICIAVIIFHILCGNNWLTFDMLIFSTAIMLLSIFFTVHHLFLYYVFQPYTKELDIKNPFYNIINGTVYFLSYLCFQIEASSIGFVVALLVFTITYIVVALILVYKLAPKNFRVK